MFGILVYLEFVGGKVRPVGDKKKEAKRHLAGERDSEAE
jgi:hypothetical protein